MRSFVGFVAALSLLVAPSLGRAADIGVAAKKLAIVDTMFSTGKAKAVYLAKDVAITKGSGTDPAQIDAELEVSYDATSGVFLAPQGSNWLINSTVVATYRNSGAPTGGATKITSIKPAKLIKLVAPSLGDTPIDISAAPTGSVLAVYTVTNDGETNRHCSSFSGCVHKLIARGTGYKLTCKAGVPAACPPLPTTSTTSSTSTSSTTSSSSSSTSTSSSTSSTSSSTSTSTSTSSTSSTSTSSTTSSSSTTTSTSSSTTTTAPPLTGPAMPPNDGTVTFNVTGAASPGSPGGTNSVFTNFIPNTSWSQLYYGPSSIAPPRAGLDGTLHAMPFSGISGTTATWAGVTSWTNPATGTVHTNVPIQLRVTITGLGGTPWLLSTSIPGLDPGPGTGIGAVANNPSAVDFTANTQFLADIPTDGAGNFIALNSVQVGGGLTRSSYTGAFYSAAP